VTVGGVGLSAGATPIIKTYLTDYRSMHIKNTRPGVDSKLGVKGGPEATLRSEHATRTDS
jgi:hypothetical protein